MIPLSAAFSRSILSAASIIMVSSNLIREKSRTGEEPNPHASSNALSVRLRQSSTKSLLIEAPQASAIASSRRRFSSSEFVILRLLRVQLSLRSERDRHWPAFDDE